MNSQSSKLPPVETSGGILSFPDFEISWVGREVTDSNYIFGSEDGRLRIGDPNSSGRTIKLDSHNESINGVALNSNWMAATTRCEVVFVRDFLDTVNARSFIYEGGAHGVMATSAGGFVAPLGRNGLLTMSPSDETDLVVSVSRPKGKEVNFYKLDHLVSDGQRDFFAVASRRRGFAGIAISSNNSIGGSGEGRYFEAPGLDIVDVCSLGSLKYPYAAAGVGADRSIHLCRDIFGIEPPQELRLSGIEGAPYTILRSQGHLFLLTNKCFYAFPDLIEDFFGQRIIKPSIRSRALRVAAVDAYQSGDEIMLLLADHVLTFSAEEAATKSPNPEEYHDLPREPEQLNWNSFPISQLFKIPMSI